MTVLILTQRRPDSRNRSAMPIKVSCSCGQAFMAKDELQGQTLLCPKCHQPLTIGEGLQKSGQRKSGGGMEDLLEEVGIKEYQGARCPRCAAPLKPGAVLCVECGFHLQTQQKVEGAKVRKAGERGHGEAADDLLARAADLLLEDKIEEKKNRAQGLPAWVYFIALTLMIGFTTAMFMIPKERAFQITGFSLVGIGALASAYFEIRILIVAFSESAVCGILCIVLSPFYWLYYIFTRWDQVGGYFLMSLGTSCVSMVGFGIVAMAPMMKEKEGGGGEALWNQIPARQAVVATLEPVQRPTGQTS